MYTILLVDDEPAVLDALMAGIAWSQMGINKVLTATDGICALQIMEKKQVDLIITDIRMPRMDGLELLSQLRALYPEVHCILLTSYGEFEYARKALQLGVENYLLKPFQQEELEKTIEKALDNIYTSRKNSNQLFRTNILSRWIHNDISSEELGERAGLLNINIYLNTYCVACILKLNNSGSASAYALSCEKAFGPSLEVYSFWDEKGRYVMILGSSSLDVKLLSEKFMHTTQDSPYQDAFTVSLGSIVGGSENVCQSYQTACTLLETIDSTGATSRILSPVDTYPYADDILAKALYALFQQEDAALREEGYNQLTNKMLQKEGDVSTLFANLAQSLIRLFEQAFPNKTGIQKEIYSRIHLFSATPAPQDYTTAITDLMEYSYLMFRYYFEQLSPVIRHAINYIHKHYADGTSIKEFCTKSKMSTAYLGYLFKKETGMFFNNYQTQYRICCALLLLQETDLQINDIAEKVGFASTSYFISCFKKQVGLSPIRYRTLKLNL